MAKIGILVPEKNMAENARMIAEQEGYDVVYCKHIATADAVNEARAACDAGAEILVARGYQARIIGSFIDIPMVTIQFTAQEIGLLIKRAKTLSRKKHPRIHIIAFENMLPDVSSMESLFDVSLDISYIEIAELAGNVIQSFSDPKPDVIIGGEIACRAAEQLGYLSLFYSATKESIAIALKSAAALSSALEKERQNAAQFETALDASFNGIIRINTEGTILVINKIAENFLGVSLSDAVGSSIKDLLPQIDMDQIRLILNGESTNLSTTIDIKKDSFFLLMQPIMYNDLPQGVILSFRKVENLVPTQDSSGRRSMLSGYQSEVTFRTLHSDSPAMQKVIEKARIFALSEQPIHIIENVGSEAVQLAKALHNSSKRKVGPFVSIDLRSLRPEEQQAALFGRSNEGEGADSGAFLKANHGTLFINRAELMTRHVQNLVIRTQLPWEILHTDALPIDSLDVRIIVCTEHGLDTLFSEKKFEADLYYILSSLKLTIPPLKDRPEDLLRTFDAAIEEYNREYNRFLTVTDKGRKEILNLPWPGNKLQLTHFCEHLILSARKKQIDEATVKLSYRELFPNIEEVNGVETLVIYDTPQASKIRELLKKNGGNRAATAKELGISTTTLWRYMKKYSVSPDFSAGN